MISFTKIDNKLSYSNAPSTRMLGYTTNMQKLQHWADAYPDKEAFVEYRACAERQTITCQELFEKSKSLGCYVEAAGIRKGDVVVFCVNNSLTMLVAMFGVQFAGGVPLFTVSNMADGSDVIESIQENKAKMLFIDAKEGEETWQIFENVRKSVKCQSLLNVIYNTGSSTLKTFCVVEGTTRDVIMSRLDGATELPVIYPEDIAVYYKTSGSSGKPKCVGHNHFGYVESTYSINDCIALDSQSSYFCDRPFGWGVGSPRTYLASGSTRVFVDTALLSQQNNIAMFADIISRESCTHAYLPGYLVSDLINSTGHESKFRSVHAINCAGESITKRHRELLGRFCEKLVIWYGSTEAAGVSAFSSPIADDYEEGIIGKPLAGNEMKLVHEDGNVVPKGTTGEVYVRNVYRFTEYRNMADKFAEAVDRDNWFHTGDLAHMRDDGNFVIHGRKSERISIGSVKIFPQDVEKVLITCPEVVAVVAVPVPDERLYNAICACVVLHKDVSMKITDMPTHFAKLWSATAILKPNYYIHFSELISNSSGKIDRKAMTLEAASRLGLQ